MVSAFTSSAIETYVDCSWYTEKALSVTTEVPIIEICFCVEKQEEETSQKENKLVRQDKPESSTTTSQYTSTMDIDGCHGKHGGCVQRQDVPHRSRRDVDAGSDPADKE